MGGNLVPDPIPAETATTEQLTEQVYCSVHARFRSLLLCRKLSFEAGGEGEPASLLRPGWGDQVVDVVMGVPGGHPTPG